jgi:hypothetical protein
MCVVQTGPVLAGCTVADNSKDGNPPNITLHFRTDLLKVVPNRESCATQIVLVPRKTTPNSWQQHVAMNRGNFLVLFAFLIDNFGLLRNNTMQQHSHCISQHTRRTAEPC